MSSILVNLISDQMVPIVLGAIHYKPSQMIYVRSQKPEYQQNVSRINRYLERYFLFDYREVIVDPFSIEDNINKLQQVIPQSDNVYINITGGTKLMAIAAFKVAQDRSIPSFYVDTANKRCIQFGTSEPDFPIERLMVQDYIELIGAGILNEKTDYFRDEHRLAKLCSIVIQNQDKWDTFSSYIHESARQYPSSTLRFEVPLTITSKQNGHPITPDIPFMCQLLQAGLLKYVNISRNKLIFEYCDQQAKNMLFTRGEWLEYYVFQTLNKLDLCDDVCAGVNIVWDKSSMDSGQLVHNELDILATRSSVLYGISCKSGKEKKEISQFLNEVEQYTRKLGGIFYKTALVVARPLQPAQLERARQMNVRVLLAGRDEQRFIQELSEWMKK